MMTYKNDPKYKNLITSKKSTSFADWKCQNQKGQQKHKIPFFKNSYKVQSKVE